jgi:hypothetical protein
MEEIPGLKEWNQKFTELLIGGELEKCHLFNVNPSYFAFDEERVWVLDGGIQLKTNKRYFHKLLLAQRHGIDGYD